MIMSTIFSTVFLFVILYNCAQSNGHGLADFSKSPSSSGSSSSSQEKSLQPPNHHPGKNGKGRHQKSITSRRNSINYDEFAREVLEQHNRYRLQHGVPPLVLSQKLSDLSQDWANTLVRRRTMTHRPNNAFGENIYRSWNSNPNFELNGKIPVDNWYEEIFDYDFNNPTFSGSTGHFTQLVWKDSKELGVGVSTDGKGTYYVVCNYDPPGNVAGYFSGNVFPQMHGN